MLNSSFVIRSGVLIEYSGTDRVVTVPDGVRVIGERAFWENKTMEKIELPSSLEYLEKDAFRECYHLSRLAFPSGLSRPTPKLIQSLFEARRVYVLGLPNVSILSLNPLLRHAGLLGLAEWEGRGNTLPADLEADVRSYLATELPLFLSEAADNLPLLHFLHRRNLLTRESVQILLDRTKDSGNPEVTALLLDAPSHLTLPDPEEEAENLTRELETGYLSEAAFDAVWTAQKLRTGGLAILEYHGAEHEALFIPAGRGEEPVTELRGDLSRGLKARSLVIPEGVHRLGYDIFFCNRTLESVSLPSTLKEVSMGAFYSCQSLSEVHMAPGIEAIRPSAFYKCVSLTELDIPEGMKRIERNAFDECVNLARVSFPSTLEYIREAAFRGCDNLKDVTFRSFPRIFGVDTLPYDHTYTIHVPHEVPAGPFLDWLQNMASRGCRVVHD